METTITISDKELETLILIENLVGANEKKLFGKNGDKCFITDDGEYIHNGHFIDYINIVEKICHTRKLNKEDK